MTAMNDAETIILRCEQLRAEIAAIHPDSSTERLIKKASLIAELKELEKTWTNVVEPNRPTDASNG